MTGPAVTVTFEHNGVNYGPVYVVRREFPDGSFSLETVSAPESPDYMAQDIDSLRALRAIYLPLPELTEVVAVIDARLALEEGSA